MGFGGSSKTLDELLAECASLITRDLIIESGAGFKAFIIKNGGIEYGRMRYNGGYFSFEGQSLQFRTLTNNFDFIMRGYVGGRNEFYSDNPLNRLGNPTLGPIGEIYLSSVCMISKHPNIFSDCAGGVNTPLLQITGASSQDFNTEFGSGIIGTDSAGFVSEGGITSNSIYNMFKPSYATYLRYHARVKTAPLVNYSNNFYGFCDSVMYSLGGADYIGFRKGTNVGTVRAENKAAAGGTTTTDNITCDLTAYHTFDIYVKAGTVKYYIDDVLVATHTTAANIPMDIPMFAITNNIDDGVADCPITIDRMAIILGEVF